MCLQHKYDLLIRLRHCPLPHLWLLQYRVSSLNSALQQALKPSSWPSEDHDEQRPAAGGGGGGNGVLVTDMSIIFHLRFNYNNPKMPYCYIPFILRHVFVNVNFSIVPRKDKRLTKPVDVSVG